MVTAAAFVPFVLSQCPNNEDYSPCSCSPSGSSNDEEDVILTCGEISQVELRSIFQRTTPAKIFGLSLTAPPAPSTFTIEDDLLNETHISGEIILTCSSQFIDKQPILISQNAFQRIKNLVQSIQIRQCDLSSLDISFLEGFVNLNRLNFQNSINHNFNDWNQFPELPNFSTLMATSVVGLNKWTKFPPNIKNLETVYLANCELDDTAVSEILRWQLDRSANTLAALQLNNNWLTEIPSEIKLFKNLKSVNLNDQQQGIKVIPSGSLSLSKSIPITSLSLRNLRTETIEADAFAGRLYLFFYNFKIEEKIQGLSTFFLIGDFRNASVSLQGNNLAKLESSVFYDMLYQMNMTKSTGYLFLPGKYFSNQHLRRL